MEQKIGQVSRKLTIMDGEGRVSELSLDALRKERIFWGRDAARNDIVIASPVVSRLHGKFKVVPQGLLFADIGSTNGTYLENAAGKHLIQKNSGYVSIKDGDMLRVQPPNGAQGNSVLLLYTESMQEGKWQKYALPAPRIAIGRGNENDIVLQHMGISRKHAVIEQKGDAYFISDCQSTNGVLVNDSILHGTYRLKDKDVIRILNSILIFTGTGIYYKSSQQGVSLRVRNMNKVVGKGKQILHDVNVDIDSNEFVAIIGGSGAGKSTLMNAISGFDKKRQGTVLFSGLNLDENFSVLKSLIGYVPQQDIIYENLTLNRMLMYTAKLKMPKDTSKEEIEKRIRDVLEMVELSEHQNTYIRKLSGGQKKRASIAVELLADPSLFFLDEPTSGLDPGTEKKLMGTLSRLAKSQGKTIIMVTHTTQSLDLCDKVIFMGQGGRVCFCGTCQEAQMFFDTDNLVDIYNEMAAQPQEWAAQYAGCVPLEPIGFGEGKEAPKKKKFSGIRQFFILTMRYAEIMKNDLPRLALLFLQPVLIALLLGIVADDRVFEIYESTKSILFALSCAGIWIGLFNSIQEICKERAILKREYMGNMKLWSYTLSKFVVQMAVGVLQAAIIVAVFSVAVGMPEKGILLKNSFPEMFVTIWLTITASMALGFIISAFVKSGDKAMACAPFVLIIQLLFSGILFELKGAGSKIAYATISKWSVESLGSIADLNSLTMKMQEELPGIEHEFQEIFEFAKKHLLSNWAVLAVMVAVCFAITTVMLRSVAKDGR